MSTTACWCGNKDLVEFSADYYRCSACETLVWKFTDPGKAAAVGLDEAEYYGKTYFLNHQAQLGLPDIYARARADLSDRCPYWLQNLLKYRRPPARVLEIGSSHGAFVALLNLVGFNAEGIDLSPWVVDFSKQTFGIPARVGPLESHFYPPASFDIIVMNDVLEHLPDPLFTLRICTRYLKPDGFIVIQTPAYPASASFDQLSAGFHPFLPMLIPEEHLHLFSRQSLKLLLSAAGMTHVILEPAYFSQYDMFCFASAGALTQAGPAEIEAALLASAGGRYALAVMDASRQNNKEKERLIRLVEEYRTLIRTMRGTKAYRALTFAGQFKWLNTQFDHMATILQETAAPSQAFPARRAGEPRKKRRMVIDLTPILPGGANGGAKIVALELIRLFSQELAPDWEYLLFTAEISHAELACLDRDNVRRMCVYNQRQGSTIAGITSMATRLSTARKLLRGIARSLPGPLHRRLAGLYQQVATKPAISSLVKQLDPDLVFAPFSAPTYYHPDIPIILVVHDLQFLYYPEFFSHEDLENQTRYFHQTCQVATQIITISEYTRKTILEQYGIPESKVTCIYHTEINPIGRPSRGEMLAALTRYGLNEQEYIFFPANFWPHKNHAMLLTALQLFVHKHPGSNLRLVLTGAPGERMDFMRTAVRQMNLQERVAFAGFVSSADYGCLLAGCKALIFPSLFEGFGLPVLEALRFGKPVFCSSTTSLPEVGGDAAGYFDPRRPLEILKALETIAFEPEKLKVMAENSIFQARRFPDVRRWAQDYLNLFEQIIDAGPQS